jgi:hypothetical protein
MTKDFVSKYTSTCCPFIVQKICAGGGEGGDFIYRNRGRKENRYDVCNRTSKRNRMNATTTMLVFPLLGISDRAVPATRHQSRDRPHLSASQGRARMRNAHSSLISVPAGTLFGEWPVPSGQSLYPRGVAGTLGIWPVPLRYGRYPWVVAGILGAYSVPLVWFGK